MSTHRLAALALLACLASAILPSAAHGQLAIDWYTVDGGSGTSSGGSFMLSGTIGQPDAGAPMAGGTFTLSGGFWAALGREPSCPADFNGDGFVTGEDFDQYVLAFEAGEPDADFNGDGFVTGEDFDAFVEAFEAGC